MTFDEVLKLVEEVIEKWYEGDLDVIGTKPHNTKGVQYSRDKCRCSADDARTKEKIQDMVGRVMDKLPKKPNQIWNVDFPPGEGVPGEGKRIINKKIVLKLTYKYDPPPKDSTGLVDDLIVNVECRYLPTGA